MRKLGLITALLLGLATTSAPAIGPGPHGGGISGGGGGSGLAQLKAALAVGQVRELTGTSAGNFNNTYPNLTTSCRSNYDWDIINSVGSPTFTSESNCASVMHGSSATDPLSSVIGWSAALIHGGANAAVIVGGSGHQQGSFSDRSRFDLVAAANTMCPTSACTGPKSNWSTLYRGAAYMPSGTASPGWSPYQAGAGYYVPNTNVNGQRQICGGHEYWSHLWTGTLLTWTGHWCDPATTTGPGGFAIADESGTTSSGGIGVWAADLDNAVFDDFDGNGYSWLSSNTFGSCSPGRPACLVKIAGLAVGSAPTITFVFNTANNPGSGGAQSQALIIRDPINNNSSTDNGKRAWFGENQFATNAIDMLTDISGTSHVEFSPKVTVWSPDPNSLGFNFNAGGGTLHYGFCKNSKLNANFDTIIVWSGTAFGLGTPNSSNPPSGWTFAAGSLTLTGDTISVGGNDMLACYYDDVDNLYIISGDARVWVVNPGANGAL